MTKPAGLAIYGGTFDPVHFGHLRSALEVAQILAVPTVKLMPSFVPPHRTVPTSTAEQRLDMLQLAITGIDCLEIDSREIQRAGVSYTIDTLRSLREEFGSLIPIYLVIGADAYVLLNEWHDWRRLSELAHLIILERPGYEHRQAIDEVCHWAAPKLLDRVDSLSAQPAGSICRLKLSQIEISATMIRESIKLGKPVDFLLPRAVIEYINENKLYEVLA